MTKPLTINIDQDKCIGCGMCVSFAPNTFAHDSNQKATLKKGRHDSPAAILNAAENCPVGAITTTKPHS